MTPGQLMGLFLAVLGSVTAILTFFMACGYNAVQDEWPDGAILVCFACVAFMVSIFGLGWLGLRTRRPSSKR